MKLMALLYRLKELSDKLDPETEVTVRTKFVEAVDKGVDDVFTEERSNSRVRLIIETKERW